MMTNTGNAEKKNKCRHDDALDDLEGRLDALCSDVKNVEDKVNRVNAFQSDQMSKATDMEKGLSKVQVDVASLKAEASHCQVYVMNQLDGEMKAVNDRITELDDRVKHGVKMDTEKEGEKGVEAAPTPTPNPKECAHCEHKAKKLRGMHIPAGCSMGGQTKRGILRTMEARLDNVCYLQESLPERLKVVEKWQRDEGVKLAKRMHELECRTAATTHIATDGWLERDKRMDAMQERIKELEKALTLSISVQKEELDKKRLKNSRVKDKFRLLDERNTTLEVTMEGQKRRLVALEDAWKGAEKDVDEHMLHTFKFPEKSRAPETFEDTARRIGLDPGKREEWTTRDYRLMYNACPKDERTGKPIVNMEQTPTYKTIANAFSDVSKNTATKPPPPSTTPSNIPAWLERFV